MNFRSDLRDSAEGQAPPAFGRSSAAGSREPLPASADISPDLNPTLGEARVATLPSTKRGHIKNNFDFIRVVAASLVLFSHHFALTGQTEPSFFHLHSFGGISVIAFFIISGYLVTSSWYNDPNFWRFCARRMLRIWPALIVVVVLTAYGLGALVTELPFKSYLLHRATFDYLGTLWMKVHYQLPGVFGQNPYPAGVNGSLWTIPLEVRCYAVLAIAGILRLLKRKYIFLILILGYWLWFFKTSSADITGTVNYGRELSAFFLAGAALYIAQTSWEHRPLRWSIITIILSAVLWYYGWKYTALLTGMPFFIIYIGTRSFPVLRRFGRWGDPSYGIYLFAFPIQQTMIMYTWPDFGFFGTLCASLLITTLLGYASWHCIEKEALKFKPSRK